MIKTTSQGAPQRETNQWVSLAQRSLRSTARETRPGNEDDMTRPSTVKRDESVEESHEEASKDRCQRNEPDDDDDATARELGESSQWVRLQQEGSKGLSPEDQGLEMVEEGIPRSHGRTSRDRRRRLGPDDDEDVP